MISSKREILKVAAETATVLAAIGAAFVYIWPHANIAIGIMVVLVIGALAVAYLWSQLNPKPTNTTSSIGFAEVADDNAQGSRGKFTFDEALAELSKVDRNLPPKLKLFLDKCLAAGFYSDVQKTIMIKAVVPGIADVNFGTIEASGALRTNYISHSAEEIGEPDIAAKYLDGIASLIDGGTVRRSGNAWTWTVRYHGNLPAVSKLLEKQDQWLGLMIRTRDRFLSAAAEKSI